MSSDKPLDMGKWKGLFDWSMKYQADGSSGGQELTPEKRAWLESALTDFMRDFSERMQEINAGLSSSDGSGGGGGGGGGTTLAQKEALCDELMEIVENVDYARDLHKIGGLPTLLSLMTGSQPSLRWRAAEVAATCMANNPPVQRWFMDGGVLPALLGCLGDANLQVVTKGLLGVSALVRHYDPGLEAFRLAGGLNKLLALLGCTTDASVQPALAPAAGQQQGGQPDPQAQQQRRRLVRKVLALLQYVLAKHPTDGFAAAEFGAAAPLRALLADPASDSDMRGAALAVLAELLATPQGWTWVKEHDGPALLGELQRLQAQHAAAVAAGDGATEQPDEEEVQLTQQLAAALQRASAPSGSGAGLQDHIELDPAQDGRERAQPHTLSVRGSGEAQEQQQQAEAQQPASGASAGLALVPVPRQDLR